MPFERIAAHVVSEPRPSLRDEAGAQGKGQGGTKGRGFVDAFLQCSRETLFATIGALVLLLSRQQTAQ